MAISEDASSPAKVTWTTTWGTAKTTAAFSPPTGSIIVAMVVGSTNTSTAGVDTVTDSASGTWHLLKRENTVGSNTQGLASVWWRSCATAPGSITVSVSATNTTSGGELDVKVLNGADTGTQAGATVSKQNDAAAAVDVAITAGATTSWIYGCGFNWDTSAAMTLASGTSLIGGTSDATDGDWWAACKSTSAAVTTSTTYGWSTSRRGKIVLVEIQAASGGGNTATGSLTLSGSASWTAPSSTGSVTLSGSAVESVGPVTGSLTFGGSVTAGPAPATGSLVLGGTAAFTVTPVTGSLILGSTAASQAAGTASGTLTLTGAAVPSVGPLSGSMTLSGSAAETVAAIAGALALAGAANWRVGAVTGSVTLSGSVQIGGGGNATASDTFSISDALTRSQGTQSRALADAMALSDALARSATESRGVSDSVAIADSLSKSFMQGRLTADTVGLSDSIGTTFSGQVVHVFTPPWRPHPLDENDPIHMGRYNRPKGVSVLKLHGVYVTVEFPTDIQINQATEVYYGGHAYRISNAVAAALTAAGYQIDQDWAQGGTGNGTSPPVGPTGDPGAIGWDPTWVGYVPDETPVGTPIPTAPGYYFDRYKE